MQKRRIHALHTKSEPLFTDFLLFKHENVVEDESAGLAGFWIYLTYVICSYYIPRHFIYYADVQDTALWRGY
jgi:hypothetical protein